MMRTASCDNRSFEILAIIYIRVDRSYALILWYMYIGQYGASAFGWTHLQILFQSYENSGTAVYFSRAAVMVARNAYHQIFVCSCVHLFEICVVKFTTRGGCRIYYFPKFYFIFVIYLRQFFAMPFLANNTHAFTIVYISFTICKCQMLKYIYFDVFFFF